MFCEGCGHTIADTVNQCPSCGQPTGAAAFSSATGTAPVAVRTSASTPNTQQQASSRLTRAEQTVYFRLARGFSWFLLIVISIGIVGVAMRLVPIVTQVFGTSTSVTAHDLTEAIASRQQGIEGNQGDINPAQMAQLDQAAYEIIRLLPDNVINHGDQNAINMLSMNIKNSASNLSKHRDEQMAMLRELRDDLARVQEAERSQAFGTYFAVKEQKIQLDQAKREEAKQNLVLLGSSLLSGIALVTFVTMILVLLSIERNTRLHANRTSESARI